MPRNRGIVNCNGNTGIVTVRIIVGERLCIGVAISSTTVESSECCERLRQPGAYEGRRRVERTWCECIAVLRWWIRIVEIELISMIVNPENIRNGGRRTPLDDRVEQVPRVNDWVTSIEPSRYMPNNPNLLSSRGPTYRRSGTRINPSLLGIVGPRPLYALGRPYRLDGNACSLRRFCRRNVRRVYLRCDFQPDESSPSRQPPPSPSPRRQGSSNWSRRTLHAAHVVQPFDNYFGAVTNALSPHASPALPDRVNKSQSRRGSH